jgi:hypothetical protein
MVTCKTRFEQLEDYKKANGDCNVSLNLMDFGLLYSAMPKKRTQLSDERKAKLDSIGFVWSTMRCHTDWDVRFQQLLEYKEIFGDCHVPTFFN